MAIMLTCPGPKAAKQLQMITLQSFHIFNKGPLLSCGYFSKGLGDHQFYLVDLTWVIHYFWSIVVSAMVLSHFSVSFLLLNPAH